MSTNVEDTSSANPLTTKRRERGRSATPREGGGSSSKSKRSSSSIPKDDPSGTVPSTPREKREKKHKKKALTLSLSEGEAMKKLMEDGSAANGSFVWVYDRPRHLPVIIQLQGFIRGYNAQQLVMQWTEFQVTRTHIVKELHDTEITYFGVLQDLVEVHLNWMSSRLYKEDMLVKKEVMEGLFPGEVIRKIYAIHAGFIKSLTKVLYEWSVHTLIGPLFTDLIDKITNDYSEYVEKYPIIQLTLQKMETDSNFLKYLTLKFDQPDIQKFSSMVITPIQRIPRYTLLLGELLKKTWTTHPDYATINLAFFKMLEVAQVVNENASRNDDARKLVELQNSLLGMKTTIASSTRRFIREGPIQQFSKGRWAERYFFLLDDMLIRTRINKKIPGTYFFIEKVPLKKVAVADSSSFPSKLQAELGTKYVRDSFAVNHPDGINYILWSDSPESWKDSIRSQVDEYAEKRRKIDEEKLQNSLVKAKLAKASIGLDLVKLIGDSNNESSQAASPGIDTLLQGTLQNKNAGIKRNYRATAPLSSLIAAKEAAKEAAALAANTATTTATTAANTATTAAISITVPAPAKTRNYKTATSPLNSIINAKKEEGVLPGAPSPTLLSPTPSNDGATPRARNYKQTSPLASIIAKQQQQKSEEESQSDQEGFTPRARSNSDLYPPPRERTYKNKGDAYKGKTGALSHRADNDEESLATAAEQKEQELRKLVEERAKKREEK